MPPINLSSLSLAACCPQPLFALPSIQAKGKSKGWVYYFLGKLEPNLLQQRIPNLKARECSCFPRHHRNMLYRNHSPMTWSTSQTRSSEVIVSFSTEHGELETTFLTASCHFLVPVQTEIHPILLCLTLFHLPFDFSCSLCFSSLPVSEQDAA